MVISGFYGYQGIPSVEFSEVKDSFIEGKILTQFFQ